MLKKFERFLKGRWNLQVFSEGKIIFKSDKSGISGLLYFSKKYGRKKDLTVFDTKVGNAVALLCVYLGVKEIFAKTGSRSAINTFKKAKIKFYFEKTVAKMMNNAGNDLCPMEKLAKGKKPKQFIAALNK